MADAEVPVPAEEIAALLARPLEEFVATRDARVKELRAEGRRPEATALKAVRKPLRLAWIVGEVARRDPDAAARAATVAADLDAAQASGAGVRPLMKAFRDEVAVLAEAAGDLGDTVDTLEVGLALREVLADPDAREAWVEGRLLAVPGDETGPTSPVRTPSAPGAAGSRPRGGAGRGGAGRAARGRRSAATARGDGAGRDVGATDRDEQAAAEVEEARREAEARLARAAEARDVAVGTRDAADEELDDARTALEGLEAERAALDERIAAARGAVDAAVAAHESASSAAGTAEADLASAEAALADLPEP